MKMMRDTCFALLALALVGTDAAQAKPRRTLTAEYPAIELHRLVLAGGDGAVEVRVHDRDVVLVEVTARPRIKNLSDAWDNVRGWFLTSAYETNEELLAALVVVGDVRGRDLRLGLEPGKRARTDRIEEYWIIVIPSRMALDVDLEAADATISGPRGGVDLAVDVGRIEIDVPTGDVEASVGVGDVVVRTTSRAVGSVVARADVGDTDLWVDGLRIDHDDPPGPGSEVELHGLGGESIRAIVSVGDAQIRIR